MEVTPWNVTGSVDYDKLITKFGCSKIDDELINRFEQVTGKKPHVWLRRGIFFSHQDLNLVLDRISKGEQIYIYTGRGSSSEIHAGHLVPFMFTKWLQDVFNAIVIIQMSDDEKYYFKDHLTLEECNRLTYENAKDIIACGFDPKKTYIFSNLETVSGSLYKNIVHLMKTTTGNQIRGIYGLTLDNNVGEISWPCFQAAPAFSSSFDKIFKKEIMCLVPMAIDQSPYFRMARDFADKMKYIKPAAIHSKFLPGLNSASGKMSSSNNSNNVIFLTDSPEMIKNKIKTAFSGGGETLKQHRSLGANLATDVAYQYLIYFLEDDDKLEKIGREYKAGIMLTSQVKNELIAILIDITKNHRAIKENISRELLAQFFDMNKTQN